MMHLSTHILARRFGESKLQTCASNCYRLEGHLAIWFKDGSSVHIKMWHNMFKPCHYYFIAHSSSVRSLVTRAQNLMDLQEVLSSRKCHMSIYVNIFIHSLNALKIWSIYCQTSGISCTLVANKNVNHSDVVGSSPIQLHLHHRLIPGFNILHNCRTGREIISFGVWSGLYKRFNGVYYDMSQGVW